MTPEEMHQYLQGKEFPAAIKINPCANVVNVPAFLKIQFQMVENWKGDLKNCPAWQRLEEFKAALDQLEGGQLAEEV